MTLADKRKVIEVLLCVGDVEFRLGSSDAAEWCGYARAIGTYAYELWSRVDDEPAFRDNWSDDMLAAAHTEAAYRLIESSETLRREWFGAR